MLKQKTTRQRVSELTHEIHNQSAPLRRIVGRFNQVLVGQEKLVRRMLIGLLADVRLLIDGVPGLAKTTTVASITKAINTGFQRLQFTPDLLPADLFGTQVYSLASLLRRRRKCMFNLPPSELFHCFGDSVEALMM